MDEDRIIQLTQAHLDGRISDQDFADLQQRLTDNPDARRIYAQFARLDAELCETGIDVIPTKTMVERKPYRPMGRPFDLRILAVAATILLLIIPVWTRWPGDEERSLDSKPVPVSPVRSVAVISAEADAVWNTDATKSLGKGTTLEPGKLELMAGLAQIDFFCGASITLAGPAVIEMRNSKLAILHSGRVRADVPPAARGFEIRASDVRLEDLGTSFGIAANANGQAKIVVFDGEVRAIDRGGRFVSLLTGDAANLAGGKASKVSTGMTSETAANDASAFPDIDAVIRQSGGLDESRYATWKAAATHRRQDPRLVAYYDFEGLTDASRRLPNQATNGGGSELDGGIVGARVSVGRWPAKTALDFRGEGDRVRFDIPGDFDAITLYAWVRIDALDRQLNSLFLTDHYDPGEIHWQLSSLGTLRFATSPAGVVDDIQAENRRFVSIPFWNSSKSGQWFLLATTVDRQARQTVTHYINGQAIGLGKGHNTDKPLPKMRIGTADLGNWTEPISPLSAIRSLNGRIDEFAIYSAALSADEIQTIYEQGKP
tara:strand:+ start:407274 stop:408908 length:1635 start_codon:yes stop_codon:yes gene_type:complete